MGKKTIFILTIGVFLLQSITCAADKGVSPFISLLLNQQENAIDCNGEVNGSAVIDACGVCGGDGSSCIGGCASGPNTMLMQGLEWQRCSGVVYGYENYKTWPEAVKYCQDLSIDDHHDWRLPTKDELKSLVVCSNGKSTPLADGKMCYLQESPPYVTDFIQPTIDPFFECRSDVYWTSSDFNGYRKWTVYFSMGIAVDYYIEYANFVRCVR